MGVRRKQNPNEEVLQQGETYEGEELLEEEEGVGVKKPIPKQLLVFGGIALAAIVVCIIIGVLLMSPSSEEEVPEEAAEELLDEDYLDTEEIFNITYTDEEKQQLRSWGYTGDEIEQAELDNTEVDVLISQAKSAMDMRLKEEYAELKAEAIKNGTPEYKKLIEDTWLNGTPGKVHSDTPDDFEAEVIRENVDYEKIPPYGKQLQVKLTLRSGDTLFMNVHPQHYEELYDNGNMVISYYVITYGGEQYICNVQEQIME